MEQQQPHEPRPTGAAGSAGAARVLVVDDDPTVSEVVAGYLDRAGYTVDRAGDGPTALARASAHWPDLVVLDLMLPGMDGLEVCRRLRGRGPVPVIMLTARGDEDDRVLGLEVGADDYVTKPFSPRELVLRVESVLRRTRPRPHARPLSAASLTIDPTARRATRNGTELALTLREFDLLAFFLRHPGRAYTREDLMREVWGWDFGDLSTVTVHVRRLRGKTETDPARPRLIQTVWGVGYRFDPDGSAEEAGASGASADAGRAPGPSADAWPAGSSAGAGLSGTSADAGRSGSRQDAGSFGLPRDAGSFGLPRDAGSFGLPRDAGSFGSPRDAGSFGSPRDAGLSGSPRDAGSFGSPRDTGLSGSPRDAGLSGSPRDTGSFGTPRDTGLSGTSADTGHARTPAADAGRSHTPADTEEG